MGYLVGYGPRYPRAPQHREASCAPSSRGASPPACTVSSALLAAGPNPSVASGAVVAGPTVPPGGIEESYTDARTAPGARVALHYAAPLLGALAGLVEARVGSASGRCQGDRGFIQQLLPSDTLVAA
jgi:hypothetical protein